MMRWLGFDFDQVGLEHMVARISGLRNSGQMNVQNTAPGTVAKDSVLWLETGHPRFHEVKVTWRIGGPTGEVIAAAQDSRNLDLEGLNLPAGTVVHAEIRDPVGPDGIDWVRNPSTANTAPNSGYNGSRFVQTRTWTVGDTTVTPSAPAPDITFHSANTRPVAADEVVYVETNHPADRVLPVTWTLNGAELPNTANRRNLDLGAITVPAGTSTLVAKVTDGALSDSVEWKIDKVAPTAARRLSTPLTTVTDTLEHPVYFGGWDMWLDPKDDTTGYTGTPAVVGQFQLNGDGWFNYFGFPEKQDVAVRVPPLRPGREGADLRQPRHGRPLDGRLRADPAGRSPDRPPHPGLRHAHGRAPRDRPGRQLRQDGVLQGHGAARLRPGVRHDRHRDAGQPDRHQRHHLPHGRTVSGAVTVSGGGTLVASERTIGGALNATGAEAVQLFGTTVNGAAKIAGSTRNVTIAGSAFKGGLALTGNTQITASERYSRLAGAYGPILAGSTVNGTLECSGNSADVKDFGAPNKITGGYSGCALAPVTPEAPVSGTVPATLSLALSARACSARSPPAHQGVHRGVIRQRDLHRGGRDAP